MFYKGIVLFALIVGCSAIPAAKDVKDDMSIFFEHADRSARIVGGTEAAIGSHPHMVAMSSGLLIRSFSCGGSLISSRHVLTAAHCIVANYGFGSLISSLRVTVGTNRWNSGGQAYSLLRNITHPHYVSATIKNDIGILVTSTNVQLSQLVQPIPLWSGYVGEGVLTRVAGWGRIRANGPISAALLELSTETISGQRCVDDAATAAIELNFPTAPHVEPHIELCTYHSAGHGNCNGDSGSALSFHDNGLQIGVVSWGFPCALGAPDMFVRVSAYIDWIVQSTSSI